MKWLGFFSLLTFSCTVMAADIERLRRGFLSLDHASVPTAIRSASQSIFKIFAPADDMEIVDLATFEDKTAPAPGQEWFKNAQIQVCRRQQIQKCPVASRAHQATAFVIRDSQTVATGFQNVREWYKLALQNNPGLRVEDLQAPVFLIDAHDKTAFSPLSTSPTLKLSFFNRAPGAFENKETEYVELHFSEPSSDRKPLAVARSFDPVSPLYLVGYALPRTHEALVSTGRLRFPPEAGALHISTSHVMSVGNSGSPLLNINGEVVSVFASAVDGKAQFVSADHAILEMFWGAKMSARTGGNF